MGVVNIIKLPNPVAKLKKRYLADIDNEDLITEIKLATEDMYPEEEGKIYINVNTVVMHIRDKPDRFSKLNSAKSPQYIKSMVTEIYSKVFGWSKYSSRGRNRSAAVFRRPGDP